MGLPVPGGGVHRGGARSWKDTRRIGPGPGPGGHGFSVPCPGAARFDDAKQPKVGESAYPYTGVSGYECMPGYISGTNSGPMGATWSPLPRSAVRCARRAVTLPVVVAGGIHTFSQAESLLAGGPGGYYRAGASGPGGPRLVSRRCAWGYGDQVRLCEYTNYCEGLDQKHKQVTCNLWDRTRSGRGGHPPEPRPQAAPDSARGGSGTERPPLAASDKVIGRYCPAAAPR